MTECSNPTLWPAVVMLVAFFLFVLGMVALIGYGD